MLCLDHVSVGVPLETGCSFGDAASGESWLKGPRDLSLLLILITVLTSAVISK